MIFKKKSLRSDVVCMLFADIIMLATLHLHYITDILLSICYFSVIVIVNSGVKSSIDLHFG